MASTELSDLTAAGSIADADLLYAVVGGLSRSVRKDVLLAGLDGVAETTYLVVAAANSTTVAKSAAALVCTGTAANAVDDAAAIAAVVDGRPLMLMPGDYYFSTILSLIGCNNQLYGAVHGKAVIHPRASVAGAVSCIGTTSSGRGTLSVQALKGATTLTLVSTALLVAGSIYNIRSTDPLSDSTPGTYLNYKGEWIEILSVDSGTVVTLKRPLSDTYTLTPTAPTLRLMTPVTDVRVVGIEFSGAGASGAATTIALDIRNFVGAKVIDCGFYDIRNYGAYFRAGIDALATQCYGKRVCIFGETAGSMVAMFGVEAGVFQGNTGGQDSRHLIDYDGFDPDPPSRGCSIVGNIAEDCVAAGLSSHVGCVGLTVVGNVALRGGGGFIVRGPTNVVTGNVAIGPFNGTPLGGYQAGYTIGNGNTAAEHGVAGTDLVFANNVFVGNRLTGSATYVTAMRIYDGLINAAITGNRFVGFTDHGILCQSNRVWDTVIEHNSFDCASINAARDAINITPGASASGNYQRDLKIRWNVVTVAPTGVCVRIAGPPSGTSSNQVKIHDNDFPSAATAVATTGNFTTPTVYRRRNLGAVTEDAYGYRPIDYDYLAWAMDPALAGSAQALSTSGRMESIALWVPAGSITGLAVGLVGSPQAAGLTAGQSKMALFSGQGAGATLVGTTADISTELGGAASALVTGTFTAVAWPGGWMRAGIWAVWSTTAPSLYRGTSSALATLLTGAIARSAGHDTGLTTTAPAVVGALSTLTRPYWFGIIGTNA